MIFFKNFIDKATSFFNQFNISNSQIIEDTQVTSVPSNSQTITSLHNLNQLDDSQKSQLDLLSLFKKFEENIVSKLDTTINNRISSEMIKHLGIDRNLTSSQILEYKNKLGYAYQSILKKKNQMKILNSHLDNNTTPEQLAFNKFPAPFFAFENNVLYVNKHNDIIQSAQKSLIQLEIDQFELDIDILNNDIKVYKDTLKYHVTDIGKLDKEIYDLQENNLKKTFETASIRALKIIAKPFTIKHSKTKNDKTIKTNKDKMKKQSDTKTNNAKDYTKNKPTLKPYLSSKEPYVAKNNFNRSRSMNSQSISNNYIRNTQPQRNYNHNQNNSFDFYRPNTSIPYNNPNSFNSSNLYNISNPSFRLSNLNHLRN